MYKGRRIFRLHVFTSVVFEVCINWSVYNNENDSSGYEIDSSKLSEPEIASQYLTDEKYYLNKFWKKN